MLVLSRKVGEAIHIPQSELVLTILAVRGGRVCLGIDAPEDVEVLRAEVWKRSREPHRSPIVAGSEVEEAVATRTADNAS